MKKDDCYIANVGINFLKTTDLETRLLEDFKIYGFDYPNVQGCFITFNVSTSTKKLDYVVKAMKTLAKNR